MNIRNPIHLSLLLAVAALAFTHQGNAQRARPGKVRAMQATVDKAGPHPATFDSTGPIKITCLNAVSETPNSNPAPSCHITAPGFNGTLTKGQSTDISKAGTITLTCNGQGFLRCDARADLGQ